MHASFNNSTAINTLNTFKPALSRLPSSHGTPLPLFATSCLYLFHYCCTTSSAFCFITPLYQTAMQPQHWLRSWRHGEHGITVLIPRVFTCENPVLWGMAHIRTSLWSLRMDILQTGEKAKISQPKLTTLVSHKSGNGKRGRSTNTRGMQTIPLVLLS